MTQQPQQQQQAQPAAYGQAPHYPQPTQSPGTNTMAILSLVFAFVFWPLGIVFGHVARSQIRRTGEGGGGLALAGLILGYLALVGTVLVIIVMVAAVSSTSGGY